MAGATLKARLNILIACVAMTLSPHAIAQQAPAQTHRMTSSASQPGAPNVSNPFALTADHPNAMWLAEIYRGSAAIQNDPTLDKETR
jgi:hypothetical protein